MDERTVAIKRESYIAAKLTRRSLGETQRGARAIVRHLHMPLGKRDEKRLVRTARRIIEECAPALWVLRVTTAHGEKRYWIKRSRHHCRSPPLRRDSERFN